MTFDDILNRKDLDAKLIKECIVRLSVLPSYTDKTFWQIFDIIINNPCIED